MVTNLHDYVGRGERSFERDGDGPGAATRTTTLYGTATTDSRGGSVSVELDGDVTGEGNSAEMPCTVDVRAGDGVVITRVGGTLGTLTVTGVVGGGDRTRAEKADASRAVSSTEDWYLVRDERPERPSGREPGGAWATSPRFPEGSSEGKCWRSTLTVRADGTWEWSEPVEEAYWSRLTQTASELTSEVKRRTKLGGRVAELGTRVTQNATSIGGKVSVGGSGIGSIDSIASLDSTGLTIGRKVGGAWRGLRQLLMGSATQFLDQAGRVLLELGVGASGTPFAGEKYVKFNARDDSGISSDGKSIRIFSAHGKASISSGYGALATASIATDNGNAVISARNNQEERGGQAIVRTSGGFLVGIAGQNGSPTKDGTPIAGIWAGSKVFTFTGSATQLFSEAEFRAITGGPPNQSRTVVLVSSGDDVAYRGTLTASLQGGNVVVSASPQKNGKIRVNYLIVNVA